MGIPTQVALVTGAGAGNGRAIALALAREGMDVAVSDVRADAAARTTAEIEAAGGHATSFTADVGSIPDVRWLIAAVGERYGRLDVLVNNAGIVRPRDFQDVTEEDWDAIFAVNTKGLFFSMQTGARLMAAGGGGAIINIASIAGRGAPSMCPPYAASKAAVICLTQLASRTLAPQRIRVNAICPGVIETDFQRSLDAEYGVRRQGLEAGEFLRSRAALIPLGRLGQAEDVARAVVFLASDAAAYITGQALNVDGGILPS